MNMTIDLHESPTSFTSLMIVAAIHLALLAGLLFGLRTVSVIMPNLKDMVATPIPPEPTKPVSVVIKPIPVKYALLPNREILPPPSFNTTPTDFPPTANGPATSLSGGNSQGVSTATTKPADIFIAAVVDAKSCAKPDYPNNSLRNGDIGVVTLELLIGLDGKVTESKIANSSGHRELDKAAVAGLSLCKFKPATLNGQPQKSWAKLQYAWNLDN